MASFILPAKRNLDFARRAYRKVDKSTGLRSDSTIRLRGPKTRTLYPDPLRRISYYAADINRRFVFLTNNFSLPALTIAELYKCRWQVELFFKWIKQYLRIKAFYGTSVNAVKDPTLDRSLCLPVGGHRQEGTQNRSQHGRNPANSQPQPFRKNPAFAGFFAGNN